MSTHVLQQRTLHGTAPRTALQRTATRRSAIPQTAWLALALCSAAVALPLAAQSTTARFDTTVARTYTVAAMLGASRAAVALVRGNPANDSVVARVERILQRVDRPAVTRMPLSLLVRASPRMGDGRQVGFGSVARWRREAEAAGIGTGDAADLDSLARLTVAELRFAMEARTPAVSDDSVDIILTPLTALHLSQLTLSIEQSLEKLNRFERKFGPSSPQLNLVEVGLNYVAQWVPLFRPTQSGWPSRFEMIASYVPTYLTYADKNARAVTVGEVGLRSYLWRRGWGGKDGGVLRPGYISFGVAVAGERDGPLTSPIKGTSRLGGFFGWGETKVAFIGGAERRVLVTRQMQIIPWVF